jgi:hypothetical protein
LYGFQLRDRYRIALQNASKEHFSVNYLRRGSDGRFEVGMTVPEHLVPILKRKNLTKWLGAKGSAEA